MAHSELSTSHEDLDNYDPNCFKFVSFSERKGQEIITVFVTNMEDDPSKNEYSYNVLVQKRKNLIEKLGIVYDNITKQ